MKITIIGTGYVGLVTGACLAETGNEVWCVDKNETKIANLRKKIIPIYEPGLEPLVVRGLQEGRLHFTADLAKAVEKTEICFLTVDTPPDANGMPIVENVFAAASQLGEVLQGRALVVTKSTVPVGTTLKVRALLQKKLGERGLPADWAAVASNPEFLKEGSSVRDFTQPDRVVVGVETNAHAEWLRELYLPFLKNRDAFLVMDIASAELAKYAANTMLACRISFINEMAHLCEQVGADIENVRQVLGTDPRIGPLFLHPGLGYGGSCLPKDVTALIQLGKAAGVSLPLLQAVDQTNEIQKERFLQKIVGHFGAQNLRKKTIALWGLAFKPETDDIRQAPSIYLIENLLKLGVKIQAFDPVAMENVRTLFGNRIALCDNLYACLEGADALVIVTEWDLFRKADLLKIKQGLKNPLLFDGRNLYNPTRMRELGFDYRPQGR